MGIRNEGQKPPETAWGQECGGEEPLQVRVTHERSARRSSRAEAGPGAGRDLGRDGGGRGLQGP